MKRERKNQTMEWQIPHATTHRTNYHQYYLRQCVSECAIEMKCIHIVIPCITFIFFIFLHFRLRTLGFRFTIFVRWKEFHKKVLPLLLLLLLLLLCRFQYGKKTFPILKFLANIWDWTSQKNVIDVLYRFLKLDPMPIQTWQKAFLLKNSKRLLVIYFVSTNSVYVKVKPLFS